MLGLNKKLIDKKKTPSVNKDYLQLYLDAMVVQ